MLSVVSQKSSEVSSLTLSYPDSVLEKGRGNITVPSCVCSRAGSVSRSQMVLAEVSQRIMTTEKLEIVWDP